MTVHRSTIAEYTRAHKLEEVLTEAVNACYVAQSENPEACLARYFMKRGFKDGVESVKLHASPVDPAEVRVEVYVNGRCEGEAQVTLPAGTALPEGLTGSEIGLQLQGVCVGDLPRVDGVLAKMGLPPAVAAGVSAACLGISTRIQCLPRRNVLARHRLDHEDSLAERNQLANKEASRFAFPYPVLWLLSAPRKSKVKGVVFGLACTAADGVRPDVATPFLFAILGKLLELNDDYTQGVDGTCVPQVLDGFDTAFEALKKAAQAVCDETGKTFEGLGLVSAVKCVDHEYFPESHKYFVDDANGKHTSELAGTLELHAQKEAEAGPTGLRLGVVYDIFHVEDTSGWKLAMQNMYGKHKVCVCRTESSQDAARATVDGSLASCVGVDIRAATITQQVGVCAAAGGADVVRPVAVSKCPDTALGLAATFFDAPPVPHTPWSQLLEQLNALDARGQVLPTPMPAQDVPLPDISDLTESMLKPQRSNSMQGGKAGKKK